jgi:hypothetical protein
MLPFTSRNVLCDVRGSHQTISFSLCRMTCLYRLDVPMELWYTLCKQFLGVFFSIQIKFWALVLLSMELSFLLCLGRVFSMDGIPCATLIIFFSIDIFIDKMEKQRCRIPTILEGNIPRDTPRTWFQCGIILGFFSNFRTGNFRIPGLFKLGDRTTWSLGQSKLRI